MSGQTYDLVIVGGGVNGCGIARDAAGRGLSVCVVEQSDLAQATSSASTKLIHGGLRYLEHYEFRLVREALIERETLWAMAPHIIWPLRFVLPHNKSQRPGWLIRIGLFLYDNLGGRKKLPASHGLNLKTDEAGSPLKEGFAKGFEYSDCWVDDARLVALNAIDARDKGADIHCRTRCVDAKVKDGIWNLTCENTNDGERRVIEGKVLVNASGPWVSKFLNEEMESSSHHSIRMVKGSHIVVPKLFDHDRCYIFQNDDKRIVFAIPYEKDFTLIGTTDEDFQGDPADVKISQDEIEYLCRLSNSYFKASISSNQVVHTYSGVRPLYDDGASQAQEATRDYVLKVDELDGAPALNIFGGKITTYRRLAEHAIEKLAGFFPEIGGAWTQGATLPGGDFPCEQATEQVSKLLKDYPFITKSHAERLIRSYGTRCSLLLGNATSPEDLGQNFGADLYEAEVRYLMIHEWAQKADDVLWRRSKLGLRIKGADKEALSEWMVLNIKKLAKAC
ncbi:glycerol-3-phosphate dehydrogenase [Kiloniella sp. EL199]|uniref:glycerol-3-phosphate dehydrogenase n=1 Tax=Kiloniella sp. EL199 TaxID=2107581 RepID=UPI000EA02CE3|nr:glycerol-3-phosphate dehydrogenase [Kiloniella sp. EL199]